MEFEDHKPIYLQIADTLCDKIISQEWLEEQRIPSVREMGSLLGVNPNTVIRSYDYLQGEEIIYNKRGIGYFVNSDAKKIIFDQRKKHFLKNEIPTLFKELDQLEISIEELTSLYKEFKESLRI